MVKRDANGRFVKGHSGNPKGRARRQTDERYIKAMQRTVTMEDWEKIIKTGIARAKAGDKGWARFLAEYLLGKPIERKEISGPDGGPIETAKVKRIIVREYLESD